MEKTRARVEASCHGISTLVGTFCNLSWIVGYAAGTADESARSYADHNHADRFKLQHQLFATGTGIIQIRPKERTYS